MPPKKNISETSILASGTFQNELSFLLPDNYKITKNRMELLKAIDETGSLSKAAKKVGMTYKAVWDAIYNIQNLSGISLILTKSGGKGGGGAVLSEEARHLLKSFYDKEKQINDYLNSLLPLWEKNEDLFGLMKRISLTTSARNQIKGTIKKIKKEPLRSDIFIQVSDHHLITASITNDSVKNLQLQPDKEVFILIKSSHVHLQKNAKNPDCKNIFQGKALRIIRGKKHAEINISIENNLVLTAMLSGDELTRLQIQEGDDLFLTVSASDVLLGIHG